jgi:cell division protein FtsB
MEEQTTLQKLSERVTEIVNQYDGMKNEIDVLRTEIVTLKSENEAKETEINRLVDENSMKDLEIEEIVNKIESILG